MRDIGMLFRLMGYDFIGWLSLICGKAPQLKCSLPGRQRARWVWGEPLQFYPHYLGDRGRMILDAGLVGLRLPQERQDRTRHV